MKDINTIIEEIAKKHSLTYIVAKYAYENNYFSINQFLDLGRDLTSEKSLEIINYFAKFDNWREVDPTLLKLASFRMEAMTTTYVCPAYIMGEYNEKV